MAYDSIKTGQCEAAIVGTANLALNCEMQWIYDDMGLMSKEGRTKAFDADGTIVKIQFNTPRQLIFNFS